MPLPAGMIIVCAWCLADGQPGFLREEPPYRNMPVSHGICSVHAEAWTLRRKKAHDDSSHAATPRGPVVDPVADADRQPAALEGHL